MKKIFLGSDHAGYDVKEHVKSILSKYSLEYEDLGTFSKKPVDYPIIAKLVVKNVLENRDSFGILICGSGEGMQIAANRFKGIRADLAYDEYSAKMARLDNDSNILVLRSREFDLNLYENIIKTFFETEFSNLERHKRRIKELDE